MVEIKNIHGQVIAQVENPEVIVRDIYGNITATYPADRTDDLDLSELDLREEQTTLTYQSLTYAKPTFGDGILVVLVFILPTCVVPTLERQIFAMPTSRMPT